MSSHSLAIAGYGMVTSVGLSAPATGAAIRAGLSNPKETRFVDWSGEWITGHRVSIDLPHGRTKIVHMAAMAIVECLSSLETSSRQDLPLILCVAENERPGRMEGLDERLVSELERKTTLRFSSRSVVIAEGRPSALLGLQHARKLVFDEALPGALVVGVDSYLNWPALSDFENRRRLLTANNSNGFMPGEAAGAVLLTRSSTSAAIACIGLGFGTERATIESAEPLRGDGIVRAIREAAADGDVAVDAFDLRISDLSGEQYYFKEAALAMARLVRRPKAGSEIWHPADCIGEVGAAVGPVALGLAAIACRKRYSPGPTILCHFSNDRGTRAAVILQHRRTE